MGMKIMLFSEDAYFMEAFSSFAGIGCPELDFDFFSDEDMAGGFLDKKGNELDAVIAGDGFFKRYEAAGVIRISMGHQTVIASEKGIHRLNIYQQGGDIAGDIKKILISASEKEILFNSTHDGKIISFFSTQGGSGKTTIAYMTAVQLAKQFQTAYLNFEEIPFTGHLYEQQYDTNMEEILFAVKDKRGLAPALMAGLKKNQDMVYTLPNVCSLNDFLDVTADDMERLLDALMELGEIDRLVIDLSACFSAVSKKVLEMSDKIFMVYQKDAVGLGKLTAFLDDPGIRQMPYRGRMKYILNKCPQKMEDNRFSVMFPFSQSMAQGVAVTSALGGNSEFVRGCSAVIDILEG